MKKKLIIAIWLFIFSYSGVSQTLTFEGLSKVRIFKRGQEYNINWSGGSDQMIKIELHNLAGKVQSWDDVQNDGEHALKLDSKLKPGKDYSFKILIGDDVVSSQTIQIKRRIPLALTISAVVIVPSIFIFLATKNNGAKTIDAVPPDTPGN